MERVAAGRPAGRLHRLDDEEPRRGPRAFSASAGIASSSCSAARDIWDKRDIRAFLLTPREQFVTAANLGRAYEWHYLDIGYGVTITGPHTVARMTNSMDVKFGDKVLEIGTGSGYQSAYLSNLTDKVWSIEIIKPLAERTRRLYDDLIARGYSEFKSITDQERRRLLRLGAGGARSTRSSSPAASITSRRRSCSS